MSAPLTCPLCGSTFVRRTRRVGALERLASLIYVYPFRCEHCLHRFRAMRWGKRYARRVAH